MTPEELVTLRKEAEEFLQEVQALDRFAERLAGLDPPPAAMSLPFRSIRRLLSLPEDPEGSSKTSPPPSTGLLGRHEDGEFVQVPRPSWEEMEVLDAYECRVSVFARRCLAGPQWGARATHEALRLGEAVMLPRAAPDARIPLPDSTISRTEADGISEALKLERELRGDRAATWAVAVDVIGTRLRGEAQGRNRNYVLSRAARYLNAAVNGRLGKKGEVVDPLEPTDAADYEERAAERRARILRAMRDEEERS